MLGASDPTPLLLAWMGPLLAEFTAPTARHALVLVTGAVLAPARRTVAAALRAAGYGQAAEFHQLSSRAEPQSLVISARGSAPVAPAGASLHPRGAGGHRPR